MFKPILIDGRPLAPAGLPAVCAPLVARSADALLAEAADLAARGPDLLEWRVDFFEGLARTDEVVDLAGRIRAAAGGLPLLFTRRSVREGGQPIPLDEPAVAALCAAVCASGHAALVDVEIANEPALLARVRDSARAAGVGLVLSFHDFGATPPVDAMVARLAEAHRLGADVAKLAVMPRGMDDVLALLQATTRASQALPIPVVTMSMGPLGALTRVAGGAFGSAMSFGMGRSASAPGQWPIGDLRQGMRLLQRAMQGAPGG